MWHGQQGMQVTDQPGRTLAVVLFAPCMVAMGRMLVQGTRHTHSIGRVLTVFGLGFFAYEVFWLSCTAKCAEVPL